MFNTINKKYFIFSCTLLCNIYSNIFAMKQETSQEMSRRFERQRAHEELQKAKPNQIVTVNPHGDFQYQLNARTHNSTARHNQFMKNIRK